MHSNNRTLKSVQSIDLRIKSLSQSRLLRIFTAHKKNVLKETNVLQKKSIFKQQFNLISINQGLIKA